MMKWFGFEQISGRWLMFGKESDQLMWRAEALSPLRHWAKGFIARIGIWECGF